MAATKKKIKRVFLTGLVVFIPAVLTIYILFFVINVMDSLLEVIPSAYHPDNLLGIHIPGLGAIVTVLLIFCCGLITTSYLGNRLVRLGERLVGRIPLVRSIYQALKQIADSLFMDRAKSFKKVVMVEYPCRGVYSIGFVTGTPNGDVQNKIGSCVGVYFPHALTPTTGIFAIVPKDMLIELEMSVEEAFTLIISGGIVTPTGHASAGNGMIYPERPGGAPGMGESKNNPKENKP
jgi:uncharacterized membrane protein